MTRDTVAIRYRRLPNREHVFHQRVVHRHAEYVVTLLQAAEMEKPVTVDGTVILEPGSPVVWFTYPECWHDIGRFHDANGRFTGVYANILTPVRMHGSRWETTDLCLDVWLPSGGDPTVLDRDELEHAIQQGWLMPDTAARAREEADRLRKAAEADRWPPAHVAHWTLERVREILPTSDT